MGLPRKGIHSWYPGISVRPCTTCVTKAAIQSTTVATHTIGCKDIPAPHQRATPMARATSQRTKSSSAAAVRHRLRRVRPFHRSRGRCGRCGRCGRKAAAVKEPHDDERWAESSH